MKIGGLQKLTLLDYPDHLACIIFTQGCNLRCPFCHNSELLDLKKDGEFSEEEIFNYLIKRRKVLDGVVITGGEPLLQPNIDLFIEQVKSLGLKVKLDTNGTSPTLLNKLIKNNLIDYIAMDIKSDWDTYKEVSGCPRINLDKIKESIKIIEEANLRYEFRTTRGKGPGQATKKPSQKRDFDHALANPNCTTSNKRNDWHTPRAKHQTK